MSTSLRGPLLRTRLRTVPLSLAAAYGVLAAMLVGGQLAALKASGLVVIKPSGGNAFQAMVREVQGNWMWLLLTGVGLSIAIVGGLMMFGSQRAPEYLFKILGGIVIITVVLPGVVH